MSNLTSDQTAQFLKTTDENINLLNIIWRYYHSLFDLTTRCCQFSLKNLTWSTVHLSLRSTETEKRNIGWSCFLCHLPLLQRFLPSEFGNDVDRNHAVDPAKSAFKTKSQIRRAIEAEKIPYTFVSSNFFAGYFLPSLAQATTPSLPTDKVIILGDGNTKCNLLTLYFCPICLLLKRDKELKEWVYWYILDCIQYAPAIFNYEEDIGTFTIKAVDDPRTLNKVLYLRPPGNIYSHNELVSLWEKKTGKTFERVYVSEEDLLKQIQGLEWLNCDV